ncbi:MAG: M23 family metallopeptidase [Bacteroidaceae bacterium]|nr:M23 family metallopeptidase [Bacteroidaceae bacterium]
MNLKQFQILFIFLVFIFISQVAISQNKSYPKYSFSSPVKIPITLSGSFGELRPNHFHSGIDIKIGGEEGEKVYSPFDGEVSRIKIQAYGGGKNLYIQHTNGYTTVYMHLQKFSYKIEKYVRNYQYEKQTYEFDINIPKGKLRIEKGELIAYAGNSGSSSGPHLHYEIRDTKTENIINPLYFGLEVADTTAPYISSILISPEGEYSRIEGMREKQIFDNIRDFDTIRVTNKISLGIKAFDQENDLSSKNGAYIYRVKVNDKAFWDFQIDEFSFSNSKYINACIDYELYSKTGQRFLFTKKLPNNQFSNFITYSNNGILEFEVYETKKIEYIIKDFQSNLKTLTFFLQSQPTFPSNYHIIDDKPTHIFYWEKENKIIDEGIKVFVPKNSLYDDCFVTYEKVIDSSSKEPIYKILSNEALHNNMELKRQIPKTLLDNPKLKNKLIVVEKKGRYSVSKGGKQEGNEIVTKVNSFGEFGVSYDTITPEINPINFKSNKKLSKKQTTLKVRIKDNLSGITTYKGYLNNKWILMEYDGKSSTLTYTIDSKELNSPTNTLRVVVTDRVGNIGDKSFKILK